MKLKMKTVSRVGMALFSLTGVGCSTVDLSPTLVPTGDALVDGKAWQAVAPAKDRVLWHYRVGATALRRGEVDEARAQLDAGLRLSDGILADAGGSEAARSRRMFRAESDKPFVGEPYERVMANFYRGLLYWKEGEMDNARALFRNGAFTDSDTELKTYAGDYVLLDYLDGFITRRLGGDGDEARERAQGRSAFSLPPYDTDANVMVFVEYGRGPRKIAEGRDGERLAFRIEPSTVVRAHLTIAGQSVALPPYDDLHYQATTRGGRVMDYILGNKAVFKRGSDAVGDAALGAAVVMASDGRGRSPRGPKDAKHEEREELRENERDREQAAVALAVVGVFGKLASAATQSAADTRTWDNLPQYISFASLRLPPGSHEALLEFFDVKNVRLDARTQRFVVHVPVSEYRLAGDPPEDLVVFRSDLVR